MTVHADLYFPLYVAGRDFADKMADRLGDVAERRLVVDATDLISGTSSFAAQLVHRLLVEGKADELIIVGAPDEFGQYVVDDADHAGVADKVQLSRTFPVGVRP